MLWRVSPGATTWTAAVGASALRGGPDRPAMVEGTDVAMRVCGAESAVAGPR